MKFSIAYYPRVTFQSKELLLFEALYSHGMMEKNRKARKELD